MSAATGRPGAPSRPSLGQLVRALARPATLSAAAAPVAVGSALAFADGRGDGPTALVALAGAVLIQLGTNLTNDLADFRRGADGAERVGPPRVLAMGWLGGRTVYRAAIAAFVLAVACGVVLAARAGWPVVVLGLASIAAGVAYTAGPFPLAYLGLGEVFVFAFFGLAAVSGTYYVQALTLRSPCLPAAVAMGALATNILVANNLRDLDGDARVGKRTLAVRLGLNAGRLQYTIGVGLAFAAPAWARAVGWVGPGWMLAWASLPWASAPLLRVWRCQGAELAPALGLSGRLQAAFALFLSLGVLLP